MLRSSTILCGNRNGSNLPLIVKVHVIFYFHPSLLVWRRLVRACGSSGWCVVAIWSLQKLSRGFPRLVALSPTLPNPDSLYSGLHQSSPSSSTPYSFPYYKSVLPQRFESTIGAAISLFLPIRVYPTVGSSVLCLSLLPPSLSTDPPSTGTPRSCISGSPLVCLNHDPNHNSKDFRRH